MVKIKICGLTRKEDIDIVNAIQPDFAGFVFAESKRRITRPLATSLVKGLQSSIQPVGVFVDMDYHEVAKIVHACGLAAIQLHGNENNCYLNDLRRLLPSDTLVIKAIRVQNKTNLSTAPAIECDLLLLDAYQEGLAGGTGEVFDWKLLQDFPQPYILAGGLNAVNLPTALDMLQPYGVDVSSGVETGGFKDRDKINHFVQTARRYNNDF